MAWENLHYFPLSVFVLLPATFIITYCIAITLGHVEIELPYISDAGTHVPECSIFAQMLNIVAVLAGITIYIRYKQIEQHQRDNLSPENARLIWFNKLTLVCGLSSALGLSMVANFRELELFKVHVVGALLAFGFGAIYCWIQTFLSFKIYPMVNSLLTARIRLILSMIMTMTFSTSCVCGPMAMRYFHGEDPTNWKPDDGGFHLHLVSTICEWISAMCLNFFILTYVRELQDISMTTPKVFLIVERRQYSFGSGDDETVQVIRASLPQQNVHDINPMEQPQVIIH